MDFNVVLQDKGSTTFDINLSTTTEAPSVTLPNNYKFIRVPSGISMSEKIR